MRPFLALALLLLAGVAGARETINQLSIHGEIDSSAKLTHGFDDHEQHPFVGALCGPGNKGQNYAHCSGVLISPTVFLTAAHCSWTAKDERTVVCFDSTIANKPEWPGIYYQIKDHGGEKYGMIGGSMHVYPDMDIAAIVLDVRQAWPAVAHPELPRLKQFDTQTPTDFTIVGYGVTRHGDDANVYAKTRRNGVSPYRSRTTHSIKLGRSGSAIACGDDSGAPFFVGSGASETRIVAGLISVADDNCTDYNYGPRMDSEAVRGFLRQFPVTLQ